MEYYSAIKKNTFESVLMRWMEGCSHSFSNSHSFEEFAVEIGTLP